MAGRIPESFIDEVLARTDIVDLVGSRVALKRGGANHLGLCPFHTEKTPSFTVSPSKQFYHCFGCGAHGTAIRFLMEYDRLDFREAIGELARNAGLELPAEAEGPAGPDHSGLYRVLADADHCYQGWLRRHAGRERAVAYLKRRGIRGQVAADYGLGFAPPGWDNLLRALGREGELLEAGLAARRDDRVYDRFRDRIMFPIRDRRGRVLGFGGRILDQGEPKYLNTPDTPVFHKGREIYGLFEALEHGRRPARLLVVEGYLDVLALAQAGVEGAVAALGTSIATAQVESLFRTAPEVVFCFDGDEAGRKAAWRALENTLPALRDGRQAGFLFLPDGEDPDSLVGREGAEAFQQRLAREARPLADVLLAQLTERVDMNSLEGRARLVEDALALLGRLPAQALRRLLLERLSSLAQVSPEYLEGRLDGGEAHELAPAPAPGRGRRPAMERSAMRVAIGLLIHRPALATMVTDRDWLKSLDSPGADLLRQLLEITRHNPKIDCAGVIQRFQGTEHERAVTRLALWQPAGDTEGQEKEFADSLQHLRALMKRQRLQYLSERLTLGQLTAEELAEWRRLKQ